ncbi:MAG: hypothetical protein U0Y68_23865 [Blastocatellia bacterium]
MPATRKRLPDGRVVPLASDLFSLFVNEFYLPHIETVKAASTVKSERLARGATGCLLWELSALRD